MIAISPQQQIWTDIRMKCVSLGYEVYDYLPSMEVGYPFVFIGEQFKQNERIHKDYLNARTQVTVHVWHNNPRKRGELSGMMDSIEGIVRLDYKSRLKEANTQIIGDNTTGTDLLHGVLDFNITY